MDKSVAILSIEREFAGQILHEGIVYEFDRFKARKSTF